LIYGGYQMVKSKIYTISIIIIVALLVVIPVAAGISGQGVSGVQIQNLSTTSPTTVTVQLWNQTGGAPINISGSAGDTIQAAAARNYYLPNLTNVPDGAYALIASATNPIAAIARTDWAATGGAAIYSSIGSGTDISIPLVTNNFANQFSQFTIQNTNTTTAVNDVTITLYGRGLSDPVRTLSNQSIPAGTSRTWSLNDAAVWGTLPNTGLDMGAPGFVGSIRITSATQLVVQSMIDLPGTPGVTAFSGVPTASASNTLFCPLIRANYFGDTGISLVNPNNNPVDATITFYADDGSPNRPAPVVQNLTIPANSSAVAFQGPGGNSRAAGLPGGTQTAANPTPTNNGFYGVARINSTGGDILAVVNDTLFGANWAVRSQSTYNCSVADDAGTEFALPLVRRFHLAATRLTTGIQVQNTTGSPVTVSMELYNWNGTRQAASDPASITIPANGSGNFWSGDWTGLPTVPTEAGGSGWYGSAILRATGDVVVVVSDEGFGTTAVDSANYNGLVMGTP
jgi:hypothetical protein